MAQVFTNDMVAHVWANQSQESGRSGNGQFFFEGPTLYSYGHHFPVGHIMPDGVVLMNGDSYSITTSRHQSRARSAASHKRQLIIPAMGRGAVNLIWILENLKDGDHVKKHLLNFVKEHVLAMGEESARYLLRLIKRERSYEKIRRDAERARAKAKEAEKKADIAQRLRNAKRFDGMSHSEFMDSVATMETRDKYISRAYGDYMGTEYRNRRTPAENLAEYAKDIWRYQDAARKHGTPALTKRIGERLKIVRARKEYLAKLEKMGADLRLFMRHKTQFRDLLSRMDRIERFEAKRLASLALWFANYDSSLISGESRSRWRAIAAELEHRENEALRRDHAERMEREREERESWLAGTGSRYFRGVDEMGGALLRAVDVERDESGDIVGGMLQTSQGVDVPLTHALKAFAFVRCLVTSGKPWQSNGKTIRVGHFRVDSISASGKMIAGCHTINFAEMERLAAQLGVGGIAPSAEALEDSK